MIAMKFVTTRIFSVVIIFFLKLAVSSNENFIFNGFINSDLSLDGVASITSNGVLAITNGTSRTTGHAFLPYTLNFKSKRGKPLSFSTTFVLAIAAEVSSVSGQGMAFVISKSSNFSTASGSQYLGLFNEKTNGLADNHVFAIEFDTFLSPIFNDIDDNHIGIDFNSLNSIASHSAGYYDDETGLITNLTLKSGRPMQVWVDFDGESMQLNVTISPLQMAKPKNPLISNIVNLTDVITNSGMHVGFSSATGAFRSYHFVSGWSFKMNGVADALDYTKLPSIPRLGPKRNKHVLVIVLPIVSCLTVVLITVAFALLMQRRLKYAELVEDWELEYRPHRFSYKELFQATKGFSEKDLLGSGGFGRVYKGVLPKSAVEIAVKKVSCESSTHGMKQFVAEIVSIGQLSHRNLVQLLGYCRRKGKLLLVYDFMPNGSLDRFLYDQSKPSLNWAQRFHIIKGVAAALLYLHEDWEQVVIHRDIKAGNVLLDKEMNGKLGDFGLAKLYDHGADLQTTHVVGTLGYLAPELVANGMATAATDTYAFGVFLLEVTCGRRPNSTIQGENIVLMDWVLKNYQGGQLSKTVDPRLQDKDCEYEVELVLKLGLLCLNHIAQARPTMRQVVQILEGGAPLPELPLGYMNLNTLLLFASEGFDGFRMTSFYSGPSISDISYSR